MHYLINFRTNSIKKFDINFQWSYGPTLGVSICWEHSVFQKLDLVFIFYLIIMFVVLSTHSIMANCITCNLVFNVIIQEFNRLLSIELVFTVVNYL